MRYKSVPRRTNHLASECHGSVTVAPTPSHLPASRHCARVNPSSLASLLALALLISSRLSVVLAVPSSRLPLHNKTIALADTLNRPTRSIDSSHRLIVGFKLEGDAKSIVDNGRYVVAYLLVVPINCIKFPIFSQRVHCESQLRRPNSPFCN